ncbi:zf-C3HC-domain-containing protein [Sporormia fimetaria CBS 119925]|uniref:Zf-C3HC-domain-containing protein n=1 Tax=Sporormia fimetaria CBS 119925 TaxID=1340428 RepID=A0A6A6VIS3_9PLEO|nr:zf-C3HC-domain-containing protein [Sporormia fimetaria CBS 119925]
MASPERQVALATTKRKFHRLLDNLTASTTTSSLASTLDEPTTSSIHSNDPTLPEPPPKRSRVSDVSMDRPRTPRAVSGNQRIKELQERLFAVRRQGDRPAGAATGAGIRAVDQSNPAKLSTPRKEPNFQPHSQGQFLSRLKTFADVKKWSHKPDAISELQWAKRGWSCDAWNTVACKGGCEQRVVVKLYPRRKDHEGKEIDMSEDMTEDVDEVLVQRYQELIVYGHYEDCLWRKRGCLDDIYHLPIANRSKSSSALLSRYHSFKAVMDELPMMDNITHPGPPVSDVLKSIPSSFFNPPGSTALASPPNTAAEITAFAFALFGWSGGFESNIALATCNHCFQRIGLWLYKDEKLKETSTKLDVPIESLRLDILQAHSEYCPWKTPESQRNPSDSPVTNMAAWETLEFVLMAMRREEKPPAPTSPVAESFQESIDDESATVRTEKSKDADSLNEKWRKFKAKLRRTASRKSLKSVKSTKSVKSVDGTALEKENDASSIA